MSQQYTQLNDEIARLKQQVETYKRGVIELRQRSDIQDALNEILSISLMHISLDEQMKRVLLLILDIPWLSLEKKGCMFLTDENDSKQLNMVAYHNLNDSLLGLCKQIQYGQCLCGIAAVKQELIFRNCIDHDHHIIPEGMQPHGHYNMPIISSGKTLGVLNLYVKHGHQQTKLECEFLKATAKALANIIERKKIEERLHLLSYTDELTGIPNRRKFMNDLEEEIKESSKHHKKFAVLFIDLDRFKMINDTYGHEYGDEILFLASQRMQKKLRSTDLIARLGGDEFVILLENISSTEKILEIASHLIKDISAPYCVKDKELSLGTSIGISLFPHHADTPEDLLKKADNALYQAKESRGNAIIYQL